MTENSNGSGGMAALPGFLLETLALLALPAGLFLLLEPTLATIAVFASLFVHGVYGFARAAREATGSSRMSVPAAACGMSHLVGGMFLAGGLSMLVTLAWVGWAYELPGAGVAPLDGLFPGLAFALVLTFLVAAACLVPSFAFLRGADEGLALFYRRILRGRAGAGAAVFLVAGVCGLAFVGVLNVGAALAGLVPIAESQNPYRPVPVWEIAAAFPVLPLTLAAAAAMLAAHRRLAPALIARVSRNTGPPPVHKRRSAWWLASAACAAVTLGGVVHVVHIGFVAALGLVAELAPVMAVANGLDDWVAEQRADGRAGAEIVAALEADGRWSRDDPERGLVTLIPELTADETAGLLESACRYRVAAGLADTAEVAGLEWLDAGQASSEVRYCLAIACPSPVVWDAPPALILYSSHASRNAYWSDNLFMDVFAEGVARPGGYCTGLGDLAENFQG